MMLEEQSAMVQMCSSSVPSLLSTVIVPKSHILTPTNRVNKLIGSNQFSMVA